jgi:hypothetical protein
MTLYQAIDAAVSEGKYIRMVGKTHTAYWKYPGSLCWSDNSSGRPFFITRETLEAKWETVDEASTM